ncbi:RNA polymerase sigma factor [Planctomycetota bacterium]
MLAPGVQDEHQNSTESLLVHLDRIVDFIYFRINKNREDARDLAQEVFLRAVRRFESYPEDLNEQYFWLCGIAKNIIREYLRTRQKNVTAMKQLELKLKSNLKDFGAGRQNVEEESTRHWTALVLSDLSPDYQEVLEQKYYNKKTTREIADMLKKSEHAVESLLARARQAFRQRWQAGLGIVDRKNEPRSTIPDPRST